MNLTNSGRTSSIDASSLTRSLSVDMAVAARTSLPVLITAPPEFALPVATEIAMANAVDGADGVAVVDAAHDGHLRATLRRASLPGASGLRAVVIHDVDGLNHAQQSALLTLVAGLGRPGPSRCRLISTTTVALFERVLDASFDTDLFYALNKIHINMDGLSGLAD
jgi:sigma-54-interacting transcriptional regulator